MLQFRFNETHCKTGHVVIHFRYFIRWYFADITTRHELDKWSYSTQMTVL